MTGLLLGVTNTQNPQGRLSSQVQKLRWSFLGLKDVLEEAEVGQLNNTEVKKWLAGVKNIHYEMIDVIDECWLSNSSHSFLNRIKQYRARCYTAKKIQDLIEEIRSAKQSAYLLYYPPMLYDKELRYRSVVIEERVYGRDHEKETLTGKLLDEDNQEHGIKYLSIVGIGGIGKTALAQLVYNDEMVVGYFHLRIWKYISETFYIRRIVCEILQDVTGEWMNGVNLEALVQRFHQTLQGKKCLIILDNVWNEDESPWEELNRFFYGLAPGSAVLITTRSLRVAQVAGSAYIMNVKCLSDEDAWSLLKQQAFPFDLGVDPSPFEELGRQIVTKSQGLPLIIKAFGGLLRTRTTVQEWQRVLLEFEKFWGVNNNMWSAFMLSYSHLPSLLRRCLVYCYIFPRNHPIDVEKLMKLWMAQNYSDYGKDDMETKAWFSFDQLLNRSFFHDLRSDENGNLLCSMDGLLTDFIEILAKKECSIVRVERDTKPLSFQEGRHWTLIVTAQASFPIPISCAKKVHTLIIIHEYSFIEPTTLANLLSHFKRLRALDLSHCLVREITHKIGKLLHLRYLDFSFNSDLKELPEALCDLSLLQSLNLNGCDNLQRIPNGIGKLTFLRHLEILWTKSLSYLPKGIGSLTALRTLNRFFGNGIAGSKACNLGDLEKLSHLQGYISIDGLGSLTNVALAERADLKNKKGLLGMDMWFSGVGSSNSKDGAVLEALQPPPNLKSLGIFCYKGTSFPHWLVIAMQLRHLMLSDCSGCEILPPLGKLPLLETLELRDMINLKNLGPKFLGIESDHGDGSELISTTRSDGSHGGEEVTSAVRAAAGGSRGKEIASDSGDGREEVTSAAGSSCRASPKVVFPMLKKLHFCNMANWKEWDEITEMEENVTIMPSLSSLSIVRCTKISAVPDYIKRIKNLSRQIEECPLLKEEMPKEN